MSPDRDALNVLYVGMTSPGNTALARCEALRRLGHDVLPADPYAAMASALDHAILGRLHYRTGYRFLQRRLGRWLDEKLLRRHHDLVWIDLGDLFGPTALRNQPTPPMLLFNVDDPTGPRDRARYHQMLRAVRHYDLCVTVRDETADDLRQLGARQVLREWRSYDEIAHAPFDDIADIAPEFRSEAVFVGTWMRGEGRDAFLLALHRAGVPVTIRGDHWSRSPLWRDLAPLWKGPAVYGRDYVAAVQGARIAIGMLSAGNRDRHTTRSLEIPYMRGLLCAQRTDEHLELYRDGTEAVFWDDADECAAHCLALLADPERAERIRVAGAVKVRSLGVGNEDMCRRVLDAIDLPASRTAMHR